MPQLNKFLGKTVVWTGEQYESYAFKATIIHIQNKFVSIWSILEGVDKGKEMRSTHKLKSAMTAMDGIWNVIDQ